MMITEQDRATARHVGAGTKAQIKVRGLGPMRFYTPQISLGRPGVTGEFITIYSRDFDAACEAAALGREYGRALRGAK